MAAAEEKWDLIVLGGGTAGIVAAKTAAGLGAQVLLIEREKTGGDCLWTGCVPSKSILAVAHVAAIAKSGLGMGVNISSVSIDFKKVMNYVQTAVNEIAPKDSPKALTDFGISVMNGNAYFVSPNSIHVNGQTFQFRKAIIATGATPSIPPIPGLEKSNFLTSESIWALDELPQNLVVLGAGSIGSELGQAFNRLGSKVTLIDGADRILPREDPSASELLHNQLILEGVDVVTSTKVLRVETDSRGKGWIEYTTTENRNLRKDFDSLLVAIGRTPRTSELGLEHAEIALNDRKFITTSKSLRTTNRRVWAAGDVTGHPQFTHVAGVHGSTAASNAILGISRKAEVRAVPRVTFTDPEIAAVGVSTTTTDPKLKLLELSSGDVDRAVTESQQHGITKVVIDSRGRIVGGMSVGPRAGESLAEITLAVRMKLKTRDIASTIHPYPTYGDGFWNIAIVDVRNQLNSAVAKSVLKVLRKVAQR